MSAGERAKELVEALDAAVSATRDDTGEELVVDAIRRALEADATTYDVVARWVRRRT